MISSTAAWAALVAEADVQKGKHLKELLGDGARCQALVAEHEGIVLDYSRENVTAETMGKLYDLAKASKLQEKIKAMASGEHINNTENRAVMHMALRAPPTKSIGEQPISLFLVYADRGSSFTHSLFVPTHPPPPRSCRRRERGSRSARGAGQD